MYPSPWNARKSRAEVSLSCIACGRLARTKRRVESALPVENRRYSTVKLCATFNWHLLCQESALFVEPRTASEQPEVGKKARNLDRNGQYPAVIR